MPTYTYECRKCQADREVVKQMSELNRIEKCPECKRRMKYVFGKPFVTPDTYRHNKFMSAYHPLENENRFGKPDEITGRSEHKRWLRRYNQKNGTNLVYD